MIELLKGWYNESVRILGIDPGFARSGWGVIDFDSGRVKAVDYGCIETSPREELPHRLLFVRNSFEKIIDDYRPDVFAIEELFFNTNAKTALRVGEARGVCIVVGVQKGLSYAMYTPLQVKSSMIGYGRATKDQVGIMVKTLLNLREIPKPDDTADALAIALCHAFSSRVLAQQTRLKAVV